MERSVRFWDRVAGKYAKAPIRDPDAYAATLVRARHYLTAGHRVLELGCGTGSTAITLSDAVALVTGTDASARMIEIANGRAAEAGVANVTFVQADVAAACAGARVDAVMAFNLLHLVEDLDAALAQVHRALPPGGVFVSKTPCVAAQELSLGLRLALGAILPVMQLLGKAPPVLRLSIAHLERRIAAAGFEIVETGNYPAMPPSRLVVARKPT